MSRVDTTPTILSTDPSRHRQAAVRRRGQLGADFLAAAADVDPVDVGARGHDLAHRAVGEADDARDDRALAFLEHARGLRLGDDQVQVPRR